MRFADNNFALVTDLIYVTFLASRRFASPRVKLEILCFRVDIYQLRCPGIKCLLRAVGKKMCDGIAANIDFRVHDQKKKRMQVKLSFPKGAVSDYCS